MLGGQSIKYVILQMNPSMKNQIDQVSWADFGSRQNINRLLGGKSIIMLYELNIQTLAKCYEHYNFETSKLIKSMSYYGLPINRRMNPKNKRKLKKL